MNNIYLSQFNAWFEQRNTRERIFLSLLCWAVLYAFFYLFLYRSLDIQQADTHAQIKNLQEKIRSWNTQITALKQISSSPLYKEWQSQQQSINRIQNQYKFLLQASPSQQWQDVIKEILESQNNVTLIEVKNMPETIYAPYNLSSPLTKIYQQPFTLTVESNYVDTINYLQQFEKLLPNVHWDKLDYQVTRYPLAKINMEFSILYEKTD